MRAELVRRLMTLATFVAMWLVAPSAFASEAEGLHEMSFAFSFASVASLASEASASEPISRETTTPAPIPDAGRAAPLCDERAATAIAPPPQLQDVEQSLDTTCAAGEDVFGVRRDGHQVERERAPSRAPEARAQEPLIGSLLLSIGRGAGVLLPAPAAADMPRLPGHRTPLDRPPRV